MDHDVTPNGFAIDVAKASDIDASDIVVFAKVCSGSTINKKKIVS